MRQNAHMAERSRVLVVGAGYAGLNAALYLNDKHKAKPEAFDLTLVDQHPYHLVKIRLHEAAPREADVTFPLAEALGGGLNVLQAGVTALDFAHRQVMTTASALS